MHRIIFSVFFISVCINGFGQHKHNGLYGMYFQWGYNREWYTSSNIHFRLDNGSDFILHKAKAFDKPDFDAIYKNPLEVSIPQYNYRVGFYLNANRTRAVELNFDHAKYVVRNFQTVSVTGTINDVPVAGDSILNPATFLHLEHTDGANWFHLNYVQQKTILRKSNHTSPLVSMIGKIGAGINIPRTDFTWKGDRLNNRFHIAGYNVSAEGGLRYYVAKKIFLEGTGKTGYVRYVNAMANTHQFKKSRVSHGFGYFEAIALIGYDIRFR